MSETILDDPFSARSVWCVAKHDLFGTKDVQNPITASYVWLADQLGHISLGLVPTLFAEWVLRGAWSWFGNPASEDHGLHADYLYRLIVLFIGTAYFYIGWRKENADFQQAHQDAARSPLPFNAKDLRINVWAALFFFGLGICIAVAAFIAVWLFAWVLIMGVLSSTLISFWWLKRKIAFQQADLPYLFRLADFTGEMRPEMAPMVLGIATKSDTATDVRHAIVQGPIKSGKTALVTGIGTEYAFSLGRARYLSLIKLMQLADTYKPNEPLAMTESDSGRLLWKWNNVDLLIVDDLDAGLEHTKIISPDDVENGMKRLLGDVPLSWLAERRSVWVLGPSDDTIAWRKAIARMIGDETVAISEIILSPRATASKVS